MRTLIARVSLLAVSLVLVGCASSTRSLPKYETPLARAAVMNVRTTAYTHTEADHVQYSNRNALGGRLQCGPIHSAAADWSRWPAGSIFRIRETGEIFQVDDYGWALAGTNTIDLYKPSRSAMNNWGVRRVTVENLRWGDPQRSLSILRPRSKHRHIKRMVDQLEQRMPEWLGHGSSERLAAAEPAPMENQSAAPAVAVAVAQPVPRATLVQPAQSVRSAQPMRTAQATRSSGTTATREAFLNSSR
jgi:3D (Asp-Asp-Asp) domain-containing protein